MAALSYLDASALVKLAVREPETDALETEILTREGLVSSRLCVTEARRAARRARSKAAVDLIEGSIAEALEALYLFDVTADICDSAAALLPPELRSGDAIHLATALAVGDRELEFVTYDERLARAAEASGLQVVQPGRTLPRRTPSR